MDIDKTSMRPLNDRLQCTAGAAQVGQLLVRQRITNRPRRTTGQLESNLLRDSTAPICHGRANNVLNARQLSAAVGVDRNKRGNDSVPTSSAGGTRGRRASAGIGTPGANAPGYNLTRSNDSRPICSLQAVGRRRWDGIVGGRFWGFLTDDKILFRGKRITKPTTMTYDCVL